jgi:hypothetical protein
MTSIIWRPASSQVRRWAAAKPRLRMRIRKSSEASTLSSAALNFRIARIDVDAPHPSSAAMARLTPVDAVRGA